MKRVLSVSIVCVAAVVASSCIRDAVWRRPDPDIEFDIRVPSVLRPGTRASLSTEDEYAVETIDVLVFRGEAFYYSASGVITSPVGMPGDGGTAEGARLRFRTRLVVDPLTECDLMVVANARELIALRYPGGIPIHTPRAEVEAALVVDMPARGWIHDMGDPDWTPIPMWGWKTGQTITEEYAATPRNINLVRMVAKVDVRTDDALVDSSDPSRSTFQLHSASIYNYATSGRLIPRIDGENGTFWEQVTYHSLPLYTTPSLPAEYASATGPLVYTVDYDPALNPYRRIDGKIYMFEAPAGQPPAPMEGGYTGNPCIVLGGRYKGDEGLSYYRVDFAQTDDSGTPTYLPILRGNSYTVKINRVVGRGYATPEEAFKSVPVNIEATVLPWVDRTISVTLTDGVHRLGLSQTGFTLSGEAHGGEGTDNLLRIFTDFHGGWTIESITDGDTGEEIPPTGWLTVADDCLAGRDKTFPLLVTANDGGVRRTAVIRIVAGTMTCDVTLSQEAIYGGGRADLLYFAAGGVLAVGNWVDMDDANKANLAFFKFGGVVGFRNVAAGYEIADLAFNPVATADYSLWRNIPAYTSLDWDEGRTDVSQTYGTKAYHTGANVMAGRGDPCRLVGLTGAAVRTMTAAETDAYRSGWRMPTVEEDIDFMNASTAYYDASDTTPMDNATYPYWGSGPVGGIGGGWFPIIGHRESASGRGPLNDDPRGYIPSRGWKDGSGAASVLTGEFYWPSSEAADAATPFGTRGTQAELSPASTSIPADRGTMRRCVKDGEVGVTAYPPTLRHTNNSLPTQPPAMIRAAGEEFSIEATTNLQGWGVKVYEGEGTGGPLLLTHPAVPRPAIAPQSMAVSSTTTVSIPENLQRTERTFTFVLYCEEYPGAGNEVVIGTWSQRRYYVVTVDHSDYGTVAVQPEVAKERGVEYGETVTLTPTTTRAGRFFNGWTTNDIQLTPWQKANKPLKINVAGDVTIAPRFETFASHGANIGQYVWANYNVSMPHAFATSHTAADARLYQYYHPERPIIAWPSTGRVPNNLGVRMSDGGTVAEWEDLIKEDSPWPSDYDSNPCPEGWIIPTTEHWNDLKANSVKTPDPATGAAVGYYYTSKASPTTSVYMPVSPRREWNDNDTNVGYSDRSSLYMVNYAQAQTSPVRQTRDWNVGSNDLQSGYSYTGAARVIRCVHEVTASDGPVLLFTGSTLPAQSGGIDVEGDTFTINVSTNLQGWGVKVFEGGADGLLLVDESADPDPAIAPNSIPVPSSVEVTVPDNNTIVAERQLTFVLYSEEQPDETEEIGTWRQYKYYTITVSGPDGDKVTVSPEKPAGKPGYEYGTPITLTVDAPAVTAASTNFFDGWTVSGGIQPTEWQKTAKEFTTPIVGDATVTPLLPAFTERGVRIGAYIWANYNVGLPHAFAPTHDNEDVWLYQYYRGRPIVAWPSNGNEDIDDSNYGIDMATGAKVTVWDNAARDDEPWSSDYDKNPCPEGWIVPTLAHWEDLKANSSWARVPATDTATGYRYTSNSDTAVSVYMPLNPRWAWDHSGTTLTDYNPNFPQYMVNYPQAVVSGSRIGSHNMAANQTVDWDVATNGIAGQISYTGAARVIRCVRIP
jgi:hypothetical protein